MGFWKGWRCPAIAAVFLVVGVAEVSAQAVWTCTFDGQRMNRPGGQWLPNGRTFTRTGSAYMSVRKAAFDSCQADAARDGIDISRVSNGCVMAVCADNSSPRREAPHVENTPSPAVTSQNVPAGQEYCLHSGGIWVPTRAGIRHFIPNGRVYSSQKDAFAQQASWDACIKGEPLGNDGCTFDGCKRGPMLPIGRPTGGSPVNPSGLPIGNFEYYWRQVNGNWASSPAPTTVQGCPHPGTASCDAPFRKTYAAGDGTTYYLNGCNAPPIQIACTVQRAGYKPPSPKPQTPASPQTNTFCQMYVDDMIATNRQGQQAKCPAFAKANLNRQAHYDWCVKQTYSSKANEQRDSSKALLKSCLSGPAPQQLPPSTGRYPPGERSIGRFGEWDLREHIHGDGSFERCTITMEKYKPMTWRLSYMGDNRIVLTVPKPDDMVEGMRKKIRYGVNRKWFDGEIHIAGGRTAMDITNTINEFSVMSTVDIPTGRSTYRVFFYSMPEAMNALKSCRARFR